MHKTQKSNHLFRVAYVSSLITTQRVDFIIPFQHTPSRALSDLYTHSPPDDLSPRRSGIPIGPKRAFQGVRCA
jgi:hypothetical protein